MSAAVEHCRDHGAAVKEVELPHIRYGVPAYYAICAAEAASNMAKYSGLVYGECVMVYVECMLVYVECMYVESMLVYVGVCWCMLVYVGVCLVCVGVCWCMYVECMLGVYWTGVCWVYVECMYVCMYVGGMLECYTLDVW